MISPTSKERNKHPLGIWYIAFHFALVTFAFGIVNSLLILYLTQQLNFITSNAYDLFAAFNSMVFTLPILSGYLGEKFGYKQMSLVGLVSCIVGMIILATSAKVGIYLGLSFLALGIATTTVTFTCLVDLSYAKQDRRRESGFTLFYLLFNIGFLAAGLSGGVLATNFSYQVAFYTAAAGLALSFFAFFITKKRITPHAERSMAPQVTYSNFIIYLILGTATFLIALIATLLLIHTELNEILLWVLIIGASGLIFYSAFQLKDKIAKLKLIAFLILCIISISFWALYMLEPSLLTIFIAHNVDRTVFGVTIPPSTYYGLDPFFIIILGSFFTWLWRYLENIEKDISLPTKFSGSLFSMGIGYLLFCVAIWLVGADHLVSSAWVITSYSLLTIAELLISPIGLSMVGRLSPEGQEGVLMGVWQLFIGFSAVVSGYLANLATIPKKDVTPELTNPIYWRAFRDIGLITVAAALISVVLIPFIKRLIGEKKQIDF